MSWMFEFEGFFKYGSIVCTTENRWIVMPMQELSVPFVNRTNNNNNSVAWEMREALHELHKYQIYKNRKCKIDEYGHETHRTDRSNIELNSKQ